MAVAQRQSILFYFRASESKRCTATSGSTNPSPSSWLVVWRARFSLPAVVFRHPTDRRRGIGIERGKRLPHLAHRFARHQCDVSSVQRGLTKARLTVAIENNGAGSAYRQTEHFSRETYPDLGRAAAAENEEMSRGAKGFRSCPLGPRFLSTTHDWRDSKGLLCPSVGFYCESCSDTSTVQKFPRSMRTEI